MPDIDLNCDLGEGCGNDADIVPLISSANIACGVHAGDEATMRETLRLCRRHGVVAGAHPGYDDRAHFGRRETGDPPETIAALVRGQLAHFLAVAGAEGVTTTHIKLHGALYNRAADDVAAATAVIDAVLTLDPTLRLVGRSGSALLDLAAERGLRTLHEVFPDRGYDAAGRLLPRAETGAVIDDPAEVAARALELALTGMVAGRDGVPLPLRAETLCLHGDRSDAATVARVVRDRLHAAGIRIAGPQ